MNRRSLIRRPRPPISGLSEFCFATGRCHAIAGSDVVGGRKGTRLMEFIRDLPPTSYGEGSFLSRFAKSDAKILNLGIGPVWLPFVHHIDWLLKSPYRYDKLFKGFIKQGKN